MSNDDVKVERDHPQTRKAEDDARGSARWNDDVVAPEGLDEREGEQDRSGRDGNDEVRGQAAESSGDAQLTDEDAAAVRRDANCFPTMGDAAGSGAGIDQGSGTAPDTGGLGGGGQGAGNNPGGTASPGGSGRSSTG